MTGFSRIPPEYTAGLPKIADTRFDHTNYSFNEIVRSTLTRALAVVTAAGGTVSESEVAIPRQAPKAPPLEQWTHGAPVRRIDFTDAAWSFRGGWKTVEMKNDWTSWQAKAAAEAGDEAEVSFQGTGFVLVGEMSPLGGRADVIIDGKKVGVAETWLPKDTFDNDTFRLFGLAPGTHNLRLVVRPDAEERSGGKAFAINRLLVFAKK
jgi:hypothetical protein